MAVRGFVLSTGASFVASERHWTAGRMPNRAIFPG